MFVVRLKYNKISAGLKAQRIFFVPYKEDVFTIPMQA